MQQRYYLDTCIWRDYFENRSDRFRPLGDWAFELIRKILEQGNVIVCSDLVLEELHIAGLDKDIKQFLDTVNWGAVMMVTSKRDDVAEAIKLSKNLKIPQKDALHAVLAKDQKAILVTRDKHFLEIIESKKPEDLI